MRFSSAALVVMFVSGCLGTPAELDGGTSASDGGPRISLDAGTGLDAGASDAGAVADFPVWRKGIAKWAWREIPGTSMTTVTVADPFSGQMVAPTARLDAWNGLAANRDTNRVYLANAGGHADWAGNEAYEIDLQQDLPRWKLLRGSTMAPDVLASNGSQGIFHNYYADGRPSSTHLYYALQFVRARNRIFKMCSGSIWGTGNESNNLVDAFSLDANDWDPAGTWAATPNGGADTGVINRPFAQHPDTEDLYTFFTAAFRKWSAADATWSKLADRPSYANDDIVGGSASAVDPVRQRVLYTVNAYKVAQHQGLLYAIDTKVLTDVTFSGPAVSDVSGAENGLAYLPSENAYLLKLSSAGRVIRIDAVTFEATELATSGAAPPSAVNGVHTKWLYLPRLKGFAYLPHGSANFWFLAVE